MNWNKNLIIVLLVSMALPGFTKGEEVRFEILMKGNSIGTISAQKQVVNDKTTYKVSSKASSRVVFKYVRETIAEVIFSGGKIESSDAKQIMNKELKEHRITRWKGSSYACKKDKGAEQVSFKKPIKLCTSMLYFHEPKGQKFIFAENYQALCPVELIQPGIYKVTLPQGKVNHYVYKNGSLDEIHVYRTMANLVFKRIS
jgi:hypothetical protein